MRINFGAIESGFIAKSSMNNRYLLQCNRVACNLMGDEENNEETMEGDEADYCS